MLYLSAPGQFQKSLKHHIINIIQMKQHDINSIDYWFPAAVGKANFEDFKHNNTHLTTKALTLKEKLKNAVDTDWRCDTFNTLGLYDPYLDNDLIVIELIERCRKNVYEFSKGFGVTKPLSSLVLKDFWFNISGPGAFQEYHQHALSHFSVVYYVTAPKNCGNIVFQSFETFTDMFTLPIEKGNFKDLSFKTCSYEPVESNVLLFRSNLIHMVEKNMSNGDRISIAINFKFEG